MANETNKSILQKQAADTLDLLEQLAKGMEEFNGTLREAVSMVNTINQATRQAAKPKA